MDEQAPPASSARPSLSSPDKIERRKRQLERELVTNMTAKMTSPVEADGTTGRSRYGRARKQKSDDDYFSTEKILPKSFKSPIPPKSPNVLSLSPNRANKMNASKSPIKFSLNKSDGPTSLIQDLLEQNKNLSRFADPPNVSPAKEPKVYVRRDLIQKRDDKSKSVTKNVFSSMTSPSKSPHNASHLNSILERSLTENKQVSPRQASLMEHPSVIKTLDFNEDVSSKKPPKLANLKNGSSKKLTRSKSLSDLKHNRPIKQKATPPVKTKDDEEEVDWAMIEYNCAYQESDVAWARVGTYPFWPCMVTREPYTGIIVRQKGVGRTTHKMDMVHVTFLGDNGRRGWVHENMLRQYSGIDEFRASRDNFSAEQKKKDPKYCAAFNISERQKKNWNIAVKEAEQLFSQPKEKRLDLLYEIVFPLGIPEKIKRDNRIKAQKLNKSMSLSESLLDSLFSPNVCQTMDKDKPDVSDFVTACLDDMAIKTGNIKIQKQSHMDIWLQKAKSKTPEKVSENLKIAKKRNISRNVQSNDSEISTKSQRTRSSIRRSEDAGNSGKSTEKKIRDQEVKAEIIAIARKSTKESNSESDASMLDSDQSMNISYFEKSQEIVDAINEVSSNLDVSMKDLPAVLDKNTLNIDISMNKNTSKMETSYNQSTNTTCTRRSLRRSGNTGFTVKSTEKKRNYKEDNVSKARTTFGESNPETDTSVLGKKDELITISNIEKSQVMTKVSTNLDSPSKYLPVTIDENTPDEEISLGIQSANTTCTWISIPENVENKSYYLENKKTNENEVNAKIIAKARTSLRESFSETDTSIYDNDQSVNISNFEKSQEIMNPTNEVCTNLDASMKDLPAVLDKNTLNMDISMNKTTSKMKTSYSQSTNTTCTRRSLRRSGNTGITVKSTEKKINYKEDNVSKARTTRGESNQETDTSVLGKDELITISNIEKSQVMTKVSTNLDSPSKYLPVIIHENTQEEEISLGIQSGITTCTRIGTSEYTENKYMEKKINENEVNAKIIAKARTSLRESYLETDTSIYDNDQSVNISNFEKSQEIIDPINVVCTNSDTSLKEFPIVLDKNTLNIEIIMDKTISKMNTSYNQSTNTTCTRRRLRRSGNTGVNIKPTEKINDKEANIEILSKTRKTFGESISETDTSILGKDELININNIEKLQEIIDPVTKVSTNVISPSMDLSVTIYENKSDTEIIMDNEISKGNQSANTTCSRKSLSTCENIENMFKYLKKRTNDNEVKAEIIAEVRTSVKDSCTEIYSSVLGTDLSTNISNTEKSQEENEVSTNLGTQVREDFPVDENITTIKLKLDENSLKMGTSDIQNTNTTCTQRSLRSFDGTGNNLKSTENNLCDKEVNIKIGAKARKPIRECYSEIDASVLITDQSRIGNSQKTIDSTNESTNLETPLYDVPTTVDENTKIMNVTLDENTSKTDKSDTHSTNAVCIRGSLRCGNTENNDKSTEIKICYKEVSPKIKLEARKSSKQSNLKNKTSVIGTDQSINISNIEKSHHIDSMNEVTNNLVYSAMGKPVDENTTNVKISLHENTPTMETLDIHSNNTTALISLRRSESDTNPNIDVSTNLETYTKDFPTSIGKNITKIEISLGEYTSNMGNNNYEQIDTVSGTEKYVDEIRDLAKVKLSENQEINQLSNQNTVQKDNVNVEAEKTEADVSNIEENSANIEQVVEKVLREAVEIQSHVDKIKRKSSESTDVREESIEVRTEIIAEETANTEIETEYKNRTAVVTIRDVVEILPDVRNDNVEADSAKRELDKPMREVDDVTDKVDTLFSNTDFLELPSSINSNELNNLEQNKVVYTESVSDQITVTNDLTKVNAKHGDFQMEMLESLTECDENKTNVEIRSTDKTKKGINKNSEVLYEYENCLEQQKNSKLFELNGIQVVQEYRENCPILDENTNVLSEIDEEACNEIHEETSKQDHVDSVNLSTISSGVAKDGAKENVDIEYIQSIEHNKQINEVQNTENTHLKDTDENTDNSFKEKINNQVEELGISKISTELQEIPSVIPNTLTNDTKSTSIVQETAIELPEDDELIETLCISEDEESIAKNSPHVNGGMHLESEVSSSDSEIKITPKGRVKENETYKDPNFLKYALLKKDNLMDEFPHLSEHEIMAFMYSTWIFQEQSKTDDIKNRDFQETNLIRDVDEKKETKRTKTKNINNKIIKHSNNYESSQNIIERRTYPKRTLKRHRRKTIRKGINGFGSTSSSESDTESIPLHKLIKNSPQSLLIKKHDKESENEEDKCEEEISNTRKRLNSSNKVILPEASDSSLSSEYEYRYSNTSIGTREKISLQNELDATENKDLPNAIESDVDVDTISAESVVLSINTLKTDRLSNKVYKEVLLEQSDTSLNYNVLNSDFENLRNGECEIKGFDRGSNDKIEEVQMKISKSHIVFKKDNNQEIHINEANIEIDEKNTSIMHIDDSQESVPDTPKRELRKRINKSIEDKNVSIEDLESESSSDEDLGDKSTEVESVKKTTEDANKYKDPEFLKYILIRQDMVEDEHPELTREQVLEFLYGNFLFEESDKTEEIKSALQEESSVVKGVEEILQAQPKKERKKKIKAQKIDDEGIEDIFIPKDKPARKTKITNYFDGSESDTEISKKSTAIVQTTEPVIDNSIDLINTDSTDLETFLQDMLKPKPNVFKGFIRERLCEICEKPGCIIKCKGHCGNMYHIDCCRRQIEPMKDKARNKKKKHSRSRKTYPESDQSFDMGDESDSDEKSQLNTSMDNMFEYKNIVIDNANDFESRFSAKMSEMLNEVTNNDEYSTDEELNWNKIKPGSCEIVDIIPKLRSPPEMDASNFKCNDCQKYDFSPCFICKSIISPKEKNEYRQKCSILHCNKVYHLDCLEPWPQTRFNAGAPSKKNEKISEHFEAITCPRHVCHTCVCDDPRGCKTRFSGDKLAKCVRCPAVYHSFTKCLPAGTKILNASHVICPRHYEEKSGKVPHHVNTSWCFICTTGGSLICCEYCPMSFHADCLNIKPPEDGYMCEDCETGRLPLYGEMVWVKLGYYRWWPGIILHPYQIPSNIMALKHGLGEFVVRFLGANDHYWMYRGRVFPYQEGDTGKVGNQRSKLDAEFNLAVEQAQYAYNVLRDRQENVEEREDIASSLLPPHYVKLRVNKPCGSLINRKVEVYEEGSSTQCDCRISDPEPCGPNTQCLNRVLLTECGPNCQTGDRCKNRYFEKRMYPKLAPRRAAHRGWGLYALEDIHKGQFVIEYVGELIDDGEFKRRMRRMHETRDENFYFLTLDKDRMIDAGPKGNAARFMNHCCEPNCETQKWTVLGDIRVGLFAIDDIPANTEVTFNYNLECAGVDKKKCYCGARRCSGYIGAKPKQDEAPPKKPNIDKKTGKRKYTKRTPQPSPILNVKKEPKSRTTINSITSAAKSKELTELEQDLEIIRNATLGIPSDTDDIDVEKTYEHVDFYAKYYDQPQRNDKNYENKHSSEDRNFDKCNSVKTKKGKKEEDAEFKMYVYKKKGENEYQYVSRIEKKKKKVDHELNLNKKNRKKKSLNISDGNNSELTDEQSYAGKALVGENIDNDLEPIENRNDSTDSLTNVLGNNKEQTDSQQNDLNGDNSNPNNKTNGETNLEGNSMENIPNKIILKIRDCVINSTFNEETILKNNKAKSIALNQNGVEVKGNHEIVNGVEKNNELDKVLKVSMERYDLTKKEEPKSSFMNKQKPMKRKSVSFSTEDIIIGYDNRTSTPVVKKAKIKELSAEPKKKDSSYENAYCEYLKSMAKKTK